MVKRRSEKDRGARGVTRRGFLGSVGAGVAAVGVVSASSAATASAVEITDAEAMVPVTLKINGRIRRLMVEPRWTLNFVLRERLGLTATKASCDRGECGSCSVLIDGRSRYSCVTLALEAEGHEIETLEGQMKGEELGVVQQAFVDEDAFQCGYCTPGQIVAAEGLLRGNPAPSPEDIRLGMSGNLCRCAAYTHIFKAVDRAAKTKKGGGA